MGLREIAAGSSVYVSPPVSRLAFATALAPRWATAMAARREQSMMPSDFVTLPNLRVQNCSKGVVEELTTAATTSC